MDEVNFLGRLKQELFPAYYGNLLTDEVVITAERMEHIMEHHPIDVELFSKYGADSVENPDLIIEDAKNSDTVFLVKKIPDTNLNVVVRLVLKADEKHPKNSVMTFYRIREKNLVKLIEKNNLLYKR